MTAALTRRPRCAAAAVTRRSGYEIAAPPSDRPNSRPRVRDRHCGPPAQMCDARRDPVLGVRGLTTVLTHCSAVATAVTRRPVRAAAVAHSPRRAPALTHYPVRAPAATRRPVRAAAVAHSPRRAPGLTHSPRRAT